MSHLRLVPPVERVWTCETCHQGFLLDQGIAEWEYPLIHNCPKRAPKETL